MPEAGEMAPDLTLSSTAGGVNLQDANRGGKVVLAFYMEDNNRPQDTLVSARQSGTVYGGVLGVGAEVRAAGRPIDVSDNFGPSPAGVDLR